MIIYKHETLAREFAYEVDWRVRMIVFALEHEALAQGLGIRITDVIRSEGVHGAARAVDCTFIDLSGYDHNYAVGEAMTGWVNASFEYGLGHDGRPRKVSQWHDAGTGWHLHIQVPDHDMVVRG